MLLNPTGKKDCEVFPRGVEASLILYDGAVKNVLQAVVTDFNYSATREIQFELVGNDDVTELNPGVLWQYLGVFYSQLEDIPNFVDLETYNQERLAFLVIYSYAELTQFEIASFAEQKSALTECFFDNSTLVIDQTVNYINITMYPTRLCSLQLVDGYAGTNAAVKGVTLDIGTT